MGRGLLWAVMEIFDNKIVVMVAQLSTFTINH